MLGNAVETKMALVIDEKRRRGLTKLGGRRSQLSVSIKKYQGLSLCIKKIITNLFIQYICLHKEIHFKFSKCTHI